MIDIKLEIALHNIDKKNKLSDITKLIIDNFTNLVASGIYVNNTYALIDDDVVVVCPTFAVKMCDKYGLLAKETIQLVQDFLDISYPSKYIVQ